MGKAKDLFKAALVVALVVAVLGGSYMGINHMALRAAANRTETLPLYSVSVDLPVPVRLTDGEEKGGGASSENLDLPAGYYDDDGVFYESQCLLEEYYDGDCVFNESRYFQEEYGESDGHHPGYNERVEGFVMPNIVLFEFEFGIRYNTFCYTPLTELPPNALSMEEAAFIGAYYAWDVLGIDIEGMYVQMHFLNNTGVGLSWSGNIPSFLDSTFYGKHWHGVVATNINALPMTMLQVWPRFASYRHYKVLQFAIDAITGERIMLFTVSQFLPLRTQVINTNHDIINDFADSIGWHDMSFDEQKAAAGLTPDRIAAYSMSAKELAGRHFAGRNFDESVIKDVSLVEESILRIMFDLSIDENGEKSMVPLRLKFEATHYSGRVATIILPIEPFQWIYPGIYISTWRNDV